MHRQILDITPDIQRAEKLLRSLKIDGYVELFRSSTLELPLFVKLKHKRSGRIAIIKITGEGLSDNYG